MSKAQAEGVIKNIIREISQECASRGNAVSETLVAFMVKSVVLHPDNDFNVDRVLTKDDVQKLIKLCVSRLMDDLSPSLDTIKMQVYFDMNYTTRREFLSEHRRVLNSRLQPVVREITDSRARTKDELESLYRKIVSSVLLRSGLGSPTDIAVVREATAALQSVFPQTELGTFIALSKKDKERQLEELTMIVTGIRLFNKECGKGGEGIDDLPAILNEAIPATSQSVNSELQKASGSAFKYTALIENEERIDIHPDAHKNPTQFGDSYQQKVSSNTDGNITPSVVPTQEDGEPAKLPIDYNLLKDALINARQYQHFLRLIMNDIILCARKVEDLVNQLDKRMEQLKATVQSKTAVPTAQVYPQFVHLSQIWTGFQDEMVLLSVLSNIFASLQPFLQAQSELFTDEYILPHLEGVEIKTDQDRISQISTLDNHRVDVNDFRAKDFDWLFPENTKHYRSLPIAYKGYCAWSLGKFNRFLLPGNPEVGLVQHDKILYSFCTKEAAYDFLENIEVFSERITDAAKRNPELIQLLEMHNQFASLTPYSREKTTSGRMIERPVAKCDTGSQTDTHILEMNIVKSYEWNEWELRRKAIKLANLRRKVTHSMQTDLSHFKRDNVSQVYLPKQTTTQTKRENYGYVTKPSAYIAGLRGMPLGSSTNPTKMDLTIDVKEQMLLNHQDTDPNPRFISKGT